MALEAVRPAPKKRPAKPGTRRIIVTLDEEHYKAIVGIAEREMREPNNMLSFILKQRMEGILADFKE